MHGVPLCARNACVSLFAVSPLPAFECRKSRRRTVHSKAAAILPLPTKHSPRRIPCAPAPRAERRLPTARLRSAGSARPSTTPFARSSSCFFRGCGGQRGFRRHWNAHHKSASRSTFIVPALNFSAMRPHDPVTNAQSEPRAFARLLGRIKRIKYSLRINHPRSIVADRHFNHLSLPSCVNSDVSALPRILHRIVCIVQNIQKDLLQLL